MKHILPAVLLMFLPLGAMADTLYLCKSYGGGTFWADGHCSKHKALIERMVSVPNGLPFDQKVQLGEQQRKASSGPSTQNQAITQSFQAENSRAECVSLKERVAYLDSMARQPQTGQMQDWIKEQKSHARSRQFQLHC